MVSFIHNGSEITTWRDIKRERALKPKAQNSEQHYQENNVFFEFQAADH